MFCCSDVTFDGYIEKGAAMRDLLLAILFLLPFIAVCSSDKSSSNESRGEKMAVISEGSGSRGEMGIKSALERIRSYDFEKNSGYEGVGNMNDEAWKVRTLAVRDLLRAGSSAGEPLREALGDDNRHVRHVAAMVLGLLQAENAVAELEKTAREDPDPIVRCQAAEALGQIRNPNAAEVLQNVAEADSNRNVKHRAELALGALDDPDPGYEEVVEKFVSMDEKNFELVQVGEKAPDFSLKDTRGNVFKLYDSLAGKEYFVLIWIFADWCGVCQVEFHDLQELEKEFAQAGVGVASLECRELYRSQRMVAGRDLWWPHLVDAAGAVAAAYGVDPMEFWVHDEWINRPSTIILDQEGIVRFAYYGTFWGDRPTIEQTLELIKTGNFEFEHPKRKK